LKKINNKEDDIFNKPKTLKITPFKFELKNVNNNVYVLVLNLPFGTKIIKEGHVCKIFKFEKYIKPDTMLSPTKDYISENSLEIIKLVSVIQWHFNITKYSYANHDDHAHLHKRNQLLHISFVDNNFYENPVYK
jgi:hypothetical protein